ncbi:MAG: VCBS repeat-containing protein [Acidobacteriota bacterium]
MFRSSLARRLRPGDFCARALPFSFKAAASVLIVALVVPMTFVAPLKRVEAKSFNSVPAPITAPPEPFLIYSPSFSMSGILASVTNTGARFATVVRGPEVPAGLENAKIPTRFESAYNSVSSVLAVANPSANAAPPAPSQPASVVDFDFDNDGKTDIGRWHSTNAEFKVKNSNGGSDSVFTIGSGPSTAIIAPGDFNGDGKTDAATFSAGTWTYKTNPTATAQTISWGTSGDIPVAGDYDGDGTTDAAIYRPSTNTWWVSKSSGGYTSTALGASGDIAVPGDYDGDGKSDVAVYRPSNGYWYINGSSVGSYTFGWGISIDTPVPADYDGDGKTDPAVFRPSTGTWYAYRSALNNGSYYTQVWGNWGDQPVPGDYDGDNKADYAVWRPTTGVWYTLKSSDSSYSIQTLGVPGDTAVPSAYLKQVGGQITGDALAAARLQPRNSTGGTDLYSQNFSWGTSLVGLPGRSGLDAGFGISYNSLVWTKVGNAMVFDPDHSNASPGFRFGFPTIEPIYYDDDKDVWAYMMITPSGGRVQFRQTVVSNTYETADSSYTQLTVSGATNPNDPVEDITIKVTTTGGTQMSYVWSQGAYRCTKIKDRNGNYISNSYDGEGRLSTMTDTLGRDVTVNYETTTGLPSTITQTWKDSNGSGSNVTHTWATLTYATATVATDFDTSLTVVGPPDSTVINVLDKITYPDGSSTKFEYNGYLQVEKVSSIAADSTSHVLNYVSTNLASPSSSQTDCPRFTETKSFVENFNSGSEITINNTAPSSATYSLPGSITGSAKVIDVWMTGHPDNLRTKTYVGASGWKEGLTIATEDCITTSSTCSDRKRWTWTDWTQDNSHPTDPSTLPYILNPRVVESRVGDGTNTKRSTIEYWVNTGTNVAIYGLVKSAFLYDTDFSTILKKSFTTYNLDTAYTSRRIIGLPSTNESYGLESTGFNLVSKMTYAHDEGNFSDSSLQQNISPTQHDSTYDSAFITGRGNLTSTTRWDVNYPTTSSYAVSSSVKYNTAGSPVARISPWDGTNTRMVRIGYADVWNDNVSRTTYAYPTVITDPAGTSLGDSNHSSTVKYRYDIGTNVEANSPAPAGNSYGKKTKRLYDSLGRLERDSVYINTAEHAYTRYEYPLSGIQSKVYSTIIDTDSDGADADDEVLSETWADGAGRVRLARTPHTFSSGNTATWAGTVTEYDVLGRVTRQSVPTEVNSSWAATGDDATRGFLWTYQKYDWMGRVVRKINTDGTDQTALNDSDILISYEGCGCAGATVTTVESDRVPIPGTSNFGRRKQKGYADILGRDFKTETFDWDGTTVYSSVVHTYNGRDQIVNTRQSGDSTYRDVTMTFDGHGRMKTRHYPIEDAGENTTWVYNPDDSIQTVTDPRGVVTTFAYNSRGLPTSISYNPGSTGVTDTPDVGFAYDNVGNRTEMTDGTGNTTYAYDSLSQITSETKYITELNDDFTINYTYAMNGAVQTYTDPQDSARKAEYVFDKVGRISEAKNTYAGALKQKLHQTQYRAWGALKVHTFSTVGPASTFSIPVHFDYDNRLNVSAHYSPYTPSQSGYQHYVEYARNADGKMNLSTDTQVQSFTRNFEYDQIGRVTKSLSGKAVHNITGTETPYRTTIAYNSFSEETSVTGKHWEVNNPSYLPAVAASTGRVTGLSYDASGNVTSESVPYVSGNRTYAFDAAGRNTSGVDPGNRALQYTQNLTTNYEGNGWRVKHESVHSTTGFTKTTYEFSSTVLGGETVGSWECDNDSNSPDIKEFFSTANGVKMKYLSQATFYDWEWISPEGTTVYGGFGTTATAEFDPRGGGLGIENPYSGGGGGYGGGGNYGDAEHYQVCQWDGSPVSCSVAKNIARLNPSWRRREKAVYLDSPLEKAPSLPPGVLTPAGSANTFAYALTVSTSKPDDRPDKGNAVEPTSDPDNDPESASNKDQRRWEVTTRMSEYPEIIEARRFGLMNSFAGGGLLLGDAPLPGREELKKNIIERLDANKGRCREFIDAVRDNLKIKATIEDLYDKVFEKGGKFVLADDIKSAGVAYYGKHGKDIGLQPVTDSAERYTNRAIHELIHRGGVSGHKNFARAGFDALSSEEQKNNPIPIKRSPGARDMDDTYSQYFSRLQNLFCPPDI